MKWVRGFCTRAGHEFFCEVDEEYIRDSRKSGELPNMVPFFDHAIDMILDLETPKGQEDLSDEQLQMVESAAETLYGLIHARFITTTRGLKLMQQKYREGAFGRCPRVFCGGQHVLPVGQSDIIRESAVKLFCPKCSEHYFPRSKHHASLDGAFWGEKLRRSMAQEWSDVSSTTKVYVPKVFGFRIKEGAEYAIQRRKRERAQSPEIGSDGSDSSTSTDGEDAAPDWVNDLCDRGDATFFCRVSYEYITYDFNLQGMKSAVSRFIPEYQLAFDRLIDRVDSDELDEEDAGDVENWAMILFGLIHARFIVTSEGMDLMQRKFLKKEFGTCLRVQCNHQALLPCGEYDVLESPVLSENAGMKLFCPCCAQLYQPYGVKVFPGAFWGTTFPHFFLLVAGRDGAGPVTSSEEDSSVTSAPPRSEEDVLPIPVAQSGIRTVSPGATEPVDTNETVENGRCPGCYTHYLHRFALASFKFCSS